MTVEQVPDDNEVYRTHAVELTRYATVLVGPDDAADVVAEAVLRVFASRQWPAVENLGGWTATDGPAGTTGD